MRYIKEVVAQAFFDAGVAAPAMNLGEAGNSGPDRMTHFVSGMFPSELARELGAFRARADEAHVTLQDVPQLRQFIDREAPEIPTDSSAARIAWHRPDGAKTTFGVFAHGAEFQDGEMASVESNSPLTIKDGAAIAEGDEACDRGKQGREDDQAQT